MMDGSLFLTIFVLFVGFYMAWNIGANDVSNAMGTSVGSGALTLVRAVFIAAIFEFAGAFFAGAQVSQTIQRGLVDPDLFLTTPLVLILGMCGALLGTGIWLQIASYFGWPVSTTHAIVGAILGFSFLQKKILFALNPVAATKKLFPLLTFLCFGTLSFNLFFRGVGSLSFSLTQSLAFASLIALFAAALSIPLLKKIPLSQEEFPSKTAPYSVISLNKAIKHLQRVQSLSDEKTSYEVSLLLGNIKDLRESVRKETRFEERASGHRDVEKMFVALQVFSACFMAFSHGSNDVAHA